MNFMLQIDGDVGTVGITSHAADALGDVVFVDLPAIGKKFVASDSFGSVESVKAASDVYSPVAGEVLEVNAVSNLFREIFSTLELTCSFQIVSICRTLTATPPS